MKPIRCRPGGFSLIELLIVLAILAAMSGMVISLTDNIDSRSRHDETARRLAELRSAVLGPDAVSAGGDLLAGGYLQDIGWLPDGAADLLRAPPIAPGVPVPKLYFDPLWRTWAGWRGPYLPVPPLRMGETEPTLYDDWGGDFYGWSLAPRSWEALRLSGNFAIRSRGSDSKKDDESGGMGAFDRDYPAAGQPLVGEAEWITNLRGLQVEVINLTSRDFSASPIQVRFRIIFPHWSQTDPLGYWPTNPDGDEHIGSAFPLDLADASDNLGRNRRLVDFGDPSRPLRVPHGRRMLFLVRASDGRPFEGVRAHAEVLVSRRLSPPSSVKLEVRS